MPSNDTAPNFSLLTEFDATQWSGLDLFSRGSNQITMPTFAQGEGFYLDAVSFLNGRGAPAGYSLGDRINTASNFGTWSITIDENDKIKIECSELFKVAFSSGVDVLGVGSTSYSANALSFTCPNDWTRGVISAGKYSFRNSTDSLTFVVNFLLFVNKQDLVIAIRERGTTNDIDDVNTTNCLEQLDINANSSSEIHWYIDNNGHVNCDYDLSLSDITWDSVSFRDALGFTGDEVVSTTVYSKTITASNPLKGALFPSRPIESHHLSVESVVDYQRIIGGGYTSNSRGAYTSSILRFHLDASADQKDLYKHFIDSFVPYVATGEKIVFYQEWGDSRRASTSVASNYGLLYTVEDEGYKGRILGHLTDPTSFDLSYPSRIRRRVPISMRIEHE